MSAFVPSFDHLVIEPKWQNKWYESKVFQAKDFDDLPKYYNLVEYPYPSGHGMHVGHIRAYASLEVISRKRRMEGYNVLFPIGFDAFGLPTENFAIKNQIHPRIVTDGNIELYIRQLKTAGFSFDFDRLIDTTDEEYYKWTQWIFLKMYEHGLVYKSKTYVNFCPDCKVVLSNEESQGGECDRCGTHVTQLEKDVWFLRITEYADKLLDGLDVLESNNRIRTEQEKWIGRSKGAFIQFQIEGSSEFLKVFTTRPDTIYGTTFMVISPEHPILETLHDQIKNHQEIHEYQDKAKLKSEFERTQLLKDKTGVRIEGIHAINPLNNKQIPVFISDYVMITYGTGAIMAVPAHDERDYEFAKKFDLDIIEVIAGGDISLSPYTSTETGTLVNSEILNGLSVDEAKKKIIDYLVKHNIGMETKTYKMKDWAFNRQRYWGEPIPIVYCDDCGTVPVPYKDLPVKLPMVEAFLPTDTGESPLANIPEFVNTTCPICGKKARRETDTMPQWAGSSWYFLRYLDPLNKDEFCSKEKQKYWGQVDWYNGGMEHVTRHLIYSRFWNHFLYDIGEVLYPEPYLKRTAQGLILGSDGEKMSKSKGNVINPLDIINEYGADTLRLYTLFIGDYEMPTPWNENGVKGCRRFLDKVWRLFEKVNDEQKHSLSTESLVHKTIKMVSEDYENMKFNTAIAKLMTLSNELTSLDQVTSKDYETLLILLNPVAPHISEELWEMLGHKEGLVFEKWPTYNETLLVEKEIEIVISINGKIRDKMTMPVDTDVKVIEQKALNLPRIIELIGDSSIKKIIVIPNKLVNIVI
ncbi:MAG: leucine--tRNA ligase [Candidatus Izemoplasmatales bacterium]|jgi:leucyl-tRNA synthetase|nr:leucine--tRNA ligase [Candidatus Izemoplasmatales bacterium]